MFIDDVIKQKEKIKQLINSNSKILNITHKGCLDGCGCSLILTKYFQNIQVIETNYSEIDSVLLEVSRNNNYDCIFVTDICTENGKELLESFTNLILIDHHDTAIQYNNPDKLLFVDGEYSATKLVFDFMTEVFGQITLSSLKNLVLYINDYDLWHHKHVESKKLNTLFYLYWNNKFIERFINCSDIEFTVEEQTYIKQKEVEFNSVFSQLKYYDLEKLNGCFVIGDSHVNDICHKLLTDKKYNIVLFRNTKSQNLSIRTNLPSLHIGNVLMKLGIGGGHKSAGGVVEKDVHKLYDKLSVLEKYLYENHKELKRS